MVFTILAHAARTMNALHPVPACGCYLAPT
jgi:hypothetical protein